MTAVLPAILALLVFVALVGAAFWFLAWEPRPPLDEQDWTPACGFEGCDDCRRTALDGDASLALHLRLGHRTQRVGEQAA